MALPNIYEKVVCDEIIERINHLQSTTKPQWGKMSVAQMLAHCNVTYEMIFDNIHPKPNPIVRFIMKILIKNKVVGEARYPQNGPTGPQFIIKDDKNFEIEKSRLIEYVKKSQALGADFFEQKESNSFGVLNAVEWNNMMYKHLNHHLTQFGV